jgi:hypothetical protein
MASPAYYTIDFTATSGGSTIPTSGSFDYDPALESFADFTVV